MTPLHLNGTWTLFLDRDGVLNRRLVGDYVKRPSEFEWLPGALPALQKLRARFGRIVVVTNQQGVGKGLMSASDLQAIHRRMRTQAATVGVEFDAVYACTALADEKGTCRKPAPDMALAAREAFPEIDFGKSIMVGDSPSDMAFGDRLGMRCVAIGERAGRDAEDTYASLYEWASSALPANS